MYFPQGNIQWVYFMEWIQARVWKSAVVSANYLESKSSVGGAQCYDLGCPAVLVAFNLISPSVFYHRIKLLNSVLLSFRETSAALPSLTFIIDHSDFVFVQCWSIVIRQYSVANSKTISSRRNISIDNLQETEGYWILVQSFKNHDWDESRAQKQRMAKQNNINCNSYNGWKKEKSKTT